MLEVSPGRAEIFDAQSRSAPCAATRNSIDIWLYVEPEPTVACLSPHAQSHHELHFNSSDTVRDIVIGLADGLTVPFALAAGLAGAVSAAHLVVTAGLAEIAAGSIAMGLGGYLASRGDTEHYDLRAPPRAAGGRFIGPPTKRPRSTRSSSNYGVDKEAATPVLRSLQANPEAYVDFMMRFELGLEERRPKAAPCGRR